MRLPGAGDDGRCGCRRLAMTSDEVVNPPARGHETTANALTWTWYEFGRHPRGPRAARRRASAGDARWRTMRLPAARDDGRRGCWRRAMRAAGGNEW